MLKLIRRRIKIVNPIAGLQWKSLPPGTPHLGPKGLVKSNVLCSTFNIVYLLYGSKFIYYTYNKFIYL